MDEKYEKIVVEIIKSQEAIIGPIAIERADKVEGLSVDWPSKLVTFSMDKLSVIDDLVGQYKQLFGQISVEVCREAAQHVAGVSADLLPKSLQ
jgi:hypothetical protein